MARDKIYVQLPVQESTQSAEVVAVTKQSVTVANGIEIADAMANKNNSMFIILETSAAATVTIKAGNNYPNRILGDLNVTLTASKPNVIILEDISRFENRDGSVYLDFGTGFNGTVYAIAKRAGLKPVV